MIDLGVAEKIISVFFKQISKTGNIEVERNESGIVVDLQNAKVLGETAYMYCAHYFEFGTLNLNIAFDSSLFNPDLDAYGALNGYNAKSAFWKATIEHGDLIFRCFVYAVESEDVLAETLMASFLDLQQKDDNGECLNKLLSYINN